MSRRSAIRVSVQTTFARVAPALVSPWVERPLLSLGLDGPLVDDAEPDASEELTAYSVHAASRSSSSRSLRKALADWLNAEL